MIFEKLSYTNAKRIEDFPDSFTNNNLGERPEYEYYGSLLEDGVPETLVMVSNAQSTEGIYVLEYIYVEESLRGCGFSEHLIAKLCEVLSNRNASYLYYADSFTFEDAPEMVRFMTSLGFMPLENADFIFKYKLSDIVIDEMYDEQLMQSYSETKIQQISDYSDMRIKKLIQAGEVYFDKADFTPNLSVFCIDEDVIHGAIVGKLFDDQVLNITVAYADNYVQEQQFFVYMFVRLIDELKKIRNKDYDIWICIKNLEVAEDMIRMLASPYEMLSIYEFVKAI